MLFVVVFVTACAAAQSVPKVTVSPTRIATPGHVMVQGSGFTPKSNVSSHLRKPTGEEYPVLPLLTDDHGEFKHDIDTLVLVHGVHELWVIDDSSNVPSNHIRFEVTAN
jgi:hypothetical protein